MPAAAMENVISTGGASLHVASGSASAPAARTAATAGPRHSATAIHGSSGSSE